VGAGAGRGAATPQPAQRPGHRQPGQQRCPSQLPYAQVGLPIEQARQEAHRSASGGRPTIRTRLG
jgi:hypothetical protein